MILKVSRAQALGQCCGFALLAFGNDGLTGVPSLNVFLGKITVLG